MKRVLKITSTEWKNGSRDKRELQVTRDLGAEALVLAKGIKTGVVEKVDGFLVHRVSTRPLGSHVPTTINRFISVFTWARYARRLRPDVISGHDYEALGIGYLSTLFLPSNRKPQLVYDAHEFELGRNANRSKMFLFWIRHIEKFLMKRCAFSIMVNDSIADEVQRIHQLAERPLVVRNIPPCWVLDEHAIEHKRAELCEALGVPIDTFLLMYHGALSPHRGIETMLRAMAGIPDTAAVILGSGSPAYHQSLVDLCTTLHVLDRVYFHEAVAISELYQYVGSASVGLIVLDTVAQSYIFALPNKYFENIQALTPVIVSDFPEIGTITKRHQIGLAVDPEDISSIQNAILQLKDDTELYRQCKQNLSNLKYVLCWEEERKILCRAYEILLK